jgi:hypothetical protein
LNLPTIHRKARLRPKGIKVKKGKVALLCSASGRLPVASMLRRRSYQDFARALAVFAKPHLPMT